MYREEVKGQMAQNSGSRRLTNVVVVFFSRSVFSRGSQLRNKTISLHNFFFFFFFRRWALSCETVQKQISCQVTIPLNAQVQRDEHLLSKTC